MLLLACTFPPGITVLSQGAAGVGMGSGNLFGHAVIRAGTLLSARITQCCSAASLTERILWDPASAGPGALVHHRYPEMDQAVLPVLTAVFCFLEDPIKARRGRNKCRGKPVPSLQLQTWSQLLPSSSTAYKNWTWSCCKPQGSGFCLPMSLPREQQVPWH